MGVGEASYSTIAPTIIADIFVKDKRTKALAVFYFAIPVGRYVADQIWVLRKNLNSFRNKKRWRYPCTSSSLLVLISVAWGT